MKLSHELAKKAEEYSICKNWRDELRSIVNKNEMIEMYLNGIDFCLSNNYPDNDFIRKNFKGEMESFGIFLDDDITLSNQKKCVALGYTTGTIEVNNYTTSEIFIKHKSKLTITAKDNSFVMVDLFDDATLHVNACNESKVCVNVYGNGKLTTENHDNSRIRIVEKNKKTY